MFFRTYLASKGYASMQPVVVACGTRGRTYSRFLHALKHHPNEFILLLVDSEGTVGASETVWEYLKKRDGWERPTAVTDHQAHLMVQCMETWLLHNKQKIADFYKRNFHPNALPVRKDVEELSCAEVVSALRYASKDTVSGEYHKIKHGPKILASLDPTKVAAASPYCQRLLDLLLQLCNEAAQLAAPAARIDYPPHRRTTRRMGFARFARHGSSPAHSPGCGRWRYNTGG